MQKGMLYLLLSALTLSLQACVPLLVGSTAATGVTVVHDRRSTGTFVEDQEIEIRFFNFKQKHPEVTEQSDISITSYNRRALLTGSATNQGTANKAVQFVRGLPGVRLVVNEIEIHGEGDLKKTLNDSYINTQVKLSLFKIKLPDFDPTRVIATTYNGSVYLMGLVTRNEGNAAAERARHISGVKRVVKHFEYITQIPTQNKAENSGVTTSPATPPGNAFLQ